MKLLTRVIILFLIVFNFRIPIFYNSVVIAVLLTTLYYFIVRGSIPFSYFKLKYNAIIIIATLIMALIGIAITVFHGETSYLAVKRFFVQLSMILAVIYAIPALHEDESTSFPNAIKLICYVFAIQGLIHICGLLFPSIGNFLFDIKTEGFKATVLDPNRGIDKFRAYALTGSIFFELPAAYGVACVMFFRILLMKGQNYITGWKGFAFIVLCFSGIVLSGRTGFIGFFVGIGLYIILLENKVFLFLKNSWKYALGLVIVFGVYTFGTSLEQRENIEEEVLPFAFEAYYSYIETGEFTTTSTEALQEKHYFRLDDETYLKGHGAHSRDTMRYPSTDSGYLNSLIFGGVFYLLSLTVYQLLFFIMPMSCASKGGSKDDKIDFFFFLTLLLYIFVLHYKETALGSLHIVETMYVYLGTTYLLTQYSKNDNVRKQLMLLKTE